MPGKSILLILLILVGCKLRAQSVPEFKTSKYLVDPQLSRQLEKYASLDSATLENSMRIKVTMDGKPFYEQNDLDCATQFTFDKKEIMITGFMGPLGWGFQFLLYGDSSRICAFASSDGDIYKYHPSDAVLQSVIGIPCVTQKLTLLATPTYKTGERISGRIDLESQDFYYVIEGKTLKATLTLSAYFKTAEIR